MELVKNKYCDENSPLKPISLYGKTKCDAEIEVENLKIPFHLDWQQYLEQATE